MRLLHHAERGPFSALTLADLMKLVALQRGDPLWPDVANHFLHQVYGADLKVYDHAVRIAKSTTRGKYMPIPLEQLLVDRVRNEGKAQVLLQLLEQRFGDLPPALQSRVKGAMPAEIDGWVNQVLNAANLDALFRGPPPR